MKQVIFYSWQSDLPNFCNKGFIQNALENAATAGRSPGSSKGTAFHGWVVHLGQPESRSQVTPKRLARFDYQRPVETCPQKPAVTSALPGKPSTKVIENYHLFYRPAPRARILARRRSQQRIGVTERVFPVDVRTFAKIRFVLRSERVTAEAGGGYGCPPERRKAQMVSCARCYHKRGWE